MTWDIFLLFYYSQLTALKVRLKLSLTFYIWLSETEGQCEVVAAIIWILSPDLLNSLWLNFHKLVINVFMFSSPGHHGPCFYLIMSIFGDFNLHEEKLPWFWQHLRVKRSYKCSYQTKYLPNNFRNKKRIKLFHIDNMNSSSSTP